MALKPNTKSGKIEFCEQHVATWVANSVDMGSSVAQVAAWNTLVTETRALYEAQKVAEDTARTANINCDTKLKQLMDATSAIIDQVRAKSKSIGNDAWALANLPVPATPTPATPPGKPSDFTVALDEVGALQLKWKNNNASGCTYQVYRQVGPTGPFEFLIGTGSKRYTDTTVPAGTSQLTYQIQATRSSGVGPWAKFVVTLGNAGSGASVTEGTPVKIAA